ncbi:hypothetical protein Sjap_003621 [Stephania japonica]|uniref:Pre-mRNA processing factor 4 (PRP4)-like domain-containing protein n=1 Tax=Stephania japonica TaxID=461633 RepID=A0AAP0KP49_9MAGN
MEAMEAQDQNPTKTPSPPPSSSPSSSPQPSNPPQNQTPPPPPPPLAALPLPFRPRPPPPPPPPIQNPQAASSDSDSDSDDNAADATDAPNYEISEESKQVRERQEKAKQDLLMKRRAVALAVPTNDSAVRARLRRLGEPVTMFGEREMERRDRLRMIMVRLDGEGQLERLLKAHEEEEEEEAAEDEGEEGPQSYPFYTEGSRALLEARIGIARYSIERAKARIARAKRRRDDPDEDEEAEMNWAVEQVKGLVLDCSEIGEDRPLTGCAFSPDGSLLATCAMNGVGRLWNMPQLSKVVPLKGHTERATDVAFSPMGKYLATASADHTAILWNTEGTMLKKFEGHLDRLARIAFHPSGKYLGTASFDKTWRLWDVDTGVELLLQEGHSRSVYGICFHNDGSLIASCGLDALARVWDLRTGRSILALEGHVKPVYGINFSPNGYHLATGGEDNTCRIWDLRKKKSIYVIPAHTNLVSQVKFEPQEGYFLATASYDMTAKQLNSFNSSGKTINFSVAAKYDYLIWSARDFKLIKTLSGHEAKIASLDIVEDGKYVATAAHDRKIKLWACRGNEKKAMDVD